ncbi:MAG: DNA-directed RNA polymerase subunit L [Minisyncoccales bacterium]
MEIKVLEKSKKKLLIEIVGEGHTLCNMIKEELNNDKSVKVASYRIEHPLVSNPVMIIEATDAQKSLKDAIKSAKKNIKDMEKEFKKIK